MLKITCDGCHKDITGQEPCIAKIVFPISLQDGYRGVNTVTKEHICQECQNKILEFINTIPKFNGNS